MVCSRCDGDNYSRFDVHCLPMLIIIVMPDAGYYSLRDSRPQTCFFEVINNGMMFVFSFVDTISTEPSDFFRALRRLRSRLKAGKTFCVKSAKTSSKAGMGSGLRGDNGLYFLTSALKSRKMCIYCQRSIVGGKKSNLFKCTNENIKIGGQVSKERFSPFIPILAHNAAHRSPIKFHPERAWADH